MSYQVAIDCERIAKSFGDFRAVDDLSFEVHTGEVFALLGPNGAGKSTTLRMILDILKPDSGKIRVLGGPISDETKNRIGYLPEERGLYRSVSVLDMMVYMGQLKGMHSADARKRSMDLLEHLELGEHARKKVSELSKGMQQKVQFATTVLHNPTLIIIDEPFSGLDPVNTLVIQELLLDFRNRGHAIVMSTHQMHQVEELADRLLMINRGRQSLYGEVDAVRKQYALHAVVVEGKGDWAHLPGVVRVQAAQNGRKGTLLYLQDETTPDDLLEAIAHDDEIELQRFELAVPSLNDIFIRVVEGERNHA
ncbi:MAG: ATP-binding cassette domain-containing protein [Anaerolineae bacterium]|nr:ATP-binding cassette domain-containing protein [Anaerolineae bacterium]